MVDNEGMGRKSSKRCCIFHKQREFGESSTDSSDNGSDESDSSAETDDEHDGSRKAKTHKKNTVARQKMKVPDSQRFHA